LVPAGFVLLAVGTTWPNMVKCRLAVTGSSSKPRKTDAFKAYVPSLVCKFKYVATEMNEPLARGNAVAYASSALNHSAPLVASLLETGSVERERLKSIEKRNHMPLRITQQECINAETCVKETTGKIGKGPKDPQTVLKVQGSLYLEDAELLEKICRDMSNETGHRLTLDLADLVFLDSESASVLCRLKREQGVTLEGLHLFIEKVIELTEAEAMVAEYLPKESDDKVKNDRSTKRARLRVIR
jgi:anti-anti-sigma regulatory factor